LSQIIVKGIASLAGSLASTFGISKIPVPKDNKKLPRFYIDI